MVLKYIIVELTFNDVPFIFPEIIQHDQFYLSIEKSISKYSPRVISGGFIKISYDEKIECYGNSFSLDVVSRKNIDSDLIYQYLGKKNEN